MTAVKIQDDIFIRTLLAKMPADVRDTFLTEQLQALKLALDGSKRKHTLDLRWRLEFWRWSFYFAFLFGRDYRELTRSQKIAERWILAIATFLFITISILFGLLTLYLIKSALNINLFPHFSLGIWDWFRKSFL